MQVGEEIAHGIPIATLAPGPHRLRPADGTVLLSGPYRTYGQLFIIDTSRKSCLLLAGMDRVKVASGQFVLRDLSAPWATEPPGWRRRPQLAPRPVSYRTRKRNGDGSRGRGGQSQTSRRRADKSESRIFGFGRAPVAAPEALIMSALPLCGRPIPPAQSVRRTAMVVSREAG